MYTIKYRLVESRWRPRRQGDRIERLFAAVRWPLLALRGQTNRVRVCRY
jgi:hypothetical protein